MNTSFQETEREQERLAFLSAAGFGQAQRISLGEDASTRRYERLITETGPLIFMDAPPAAEGRPCGPDATKKDRILAGWNGRTRLAACRVDAFVAIADYLRGLGLSAPQVIAFDVARGFAVLEDLGEGIFAREIEAGKDEAELYDAATDALIQAHKSPPPEALGAGEWTWPILNYDRLAITTGSELFPKWYPAYDPEVRFTGGTARDYDEVTDHLAAQLERADQVFMLRDYHAENLIWRPGETGLARVGILDFQDAVKGPAAWDLAMFVQDARRDVSPAVQAHVLQKYVREMGSDPAAFERDFAIAGALNALRIVGLFARLIHRDGKPRYAAFVDREWAYLKTCLTHPELGDLRSIVTAAAPNRMEA